jgi:SpoIID/LytB domain protein
VDRVPIEDFVRSVVPGEMGPANPPEALKAQAVSTRSYFLAGRNDGTAFLAFDVEADAATQSYQGADSEKPATTEAVDATAFEVRTWKGHIARTFYHAAGGGATEASMNVFTDAAGTPGTRVPYLMGGPDVDEQGRAYDEDSPMYDWHTRAMTLHQLSRVLARDPRTNVGELAAWPVGSEGSYLAAREAAVASDARDITPAPVNRGVSGRLTWVVLKGVRNGKPVRKRVAGWLFKQVFDEYRGSGDPLGSTMIFRQRVP